MSNALRKQYRTLLEAPEILVMPGVFDGFRTAIVKKIGFKAGFVSGAGISESALGLADMGVWASRIISREPGRWPLGRDDRGTGLAETVRTSCWKECHSV